MCLCFKHQPKHKWSLLTEDGTGYSFSLRLFCDAGLIKLSVVKNSCSVFQSTLSLSRNWLLDSRHIARAGRKNVSFDNPSKCSCLIRSPTKGVFSDTILTNCCSSKWPHCLPALLFLHEHKRAGTHFVPCLLLMPYSLPPKKKNDCV